MRIDKLRPEAYCATRGCLWKRGHDGVHSFERSALDAARIRREIAEKAVALILRWPGRVDNRPELAAQLFELAERGQ